MASETVDMAPADVEIEERYLAGTPNAPLHLFRPFKTYVELREIDLNALNNSYVSDDPLAQKPDYSVCTRIDDEVFLQRLTGRFNEWLDELQKKAKNGEETHGDGDVLDEMNCGRVKFVGHPPKGMEYVSKPRELKAPFKAKKAKRTEKTKENKDVKVEGKKKPTSRKTTQDKYIYGHGAAKPFDSMTKFVRHAYHLIGRLTEDPNDYDSCECKVCDEAYDFL
ncbi:hypothetical protein KCU98_g1015, partial [Aureobasidium melanogenum]